MHMCIYAYIPYMVHCLQITSPSEQEKIVLHLLVFAESAIQKEFDISCLRFNMNRHSIVVVVLVSAMNVVFL